MGKIVRIARIVVSLIIFFILTFFLIFFMTSIPILAKGLTELFVLIFFVLISLVLPRDLGRTTNRKHTLKNAVIVLIASLVWYLCARAIYLSPIFPSVLRFNLMACAICLLAVALNRQFILFMFLLALFVLQFGLTFLFSDPLFATLGLVITLPSALIWAANNKLSFLKATVSISLCAALFFIYYRMAFDIKLVVPVGVLLITAILIALQHRWRISGYIMKFALFSVMLNTILSLLAIFSAFAWLSSPVQSLIAKSQKGVDILLPPRSLPAGVRVFLPQEEGWLVVLYDIDIYDWKSYISIAMIDKKGNIIKPPLETSARLDNIVCLADLPNVCFVLGLHGRLVCALDLNEWRAIACSKEEGPWGHLSVSPDGEFAATYSDAVPESRLRVHYFGDMLRRARNEKPYALISALNIPTDLRYCCAGNAIQFLENRRLIVHDFIERALYVFDVDKSSLKLRDKIEEYSRYAPIAFKMIPFNDSNKVLIPLPLYIKDVLPEGALEVFNLRTKRAETRINSPLMIGLRLLVYIPEFDAYCAATEFGLLFFLNKDLKIKKVLYGGAHIRDIYVRGTELYFASQAGLLRVDLKTVEL